MAYKKLIGKTTIEFKRPLDLNEIDELLKYVAEKMPANVFREK